MTNGFLNSVTDLLKGLTERSGVFDTRGPLIHVANGVLVRDGDNFKLVPFSKDYYSRNQSPITFDPHAKCPRFLNELLRPALEEDHIAITQQWSGVCLMGRNITQRFMLFFGSAGSGKSTTTSIVERVIGLHNVTSLRTNQLLDRFEFHSFIGKSLLVAKDVPGDFMSNPGSTMIKQLVGGDILTAEGKGANNRIQLKGQYNIAVTSNSRLRLKVEGDSDAWRRRLLCAQFSREKPAKPIRDFENVLIAEEGSGILNWMIEGAERHLAELTRSGDYAQTARQRASVDEMLFESDSVRAFVCSQLVERHGADVSSAELVNAYVDYCELRRWDALSRRTVENQLPALMSERFRTAKRNDIVRGGKMQRGFVNIAIDPKAD